LNGYGEYYWKNGNVYRGNWFDNMFQGYGVLLYKDGRVYEGEFQQD
jgi:hypothetical protein